MPKLRLVTREHSLLYAMRLFADEPVEEREHPRVTVTLPDGRDEELTVHVIRGNREEIRRQLLQSIDAFFELYEDAAP
jgi:hypothetical protein